MYPLNREKAYPQDEWCIAAYDKEVTDNILSRRFFDEQVVLYRTEDGMINALSGLCAHRFMPLHLGSVEMGNLVCPYHGYTYDREGRCVHVPGSDRTSSRARLRRFPVVEMGPFIWIWMGNPDRADTALLPDLAELGLSGSGEGFAVTYGKILPMKARPAILMDNLFDLSHIGFIHKETIPGGDALCAVPPVVEEWNGRYRVARHIAGFVATADSFQGTAVKPIADRPVYAIVLTDYYSPTVVNSATWYYELNDDGTAGAPIAQLNFVHGVTPETANSTHYSNVVTRNYNLIDESLDELLAWESDAVRIEDVHALEMIETSAPELSTKIENSTKSDEGALKVRRILAKLIDAEVRLPA